MGSGLGGGAAPTVREMFFSRTWDKAGCKTMWLLAVRAPRNRRLNWKRRSLLLLRSL